jgi:dUTP pyrophosphatase
MLLCKKLDPRATLPTIGHPGEDLAYDLYALESMAICPGVSNKVRTGIAARYVNGCEPPVGLLKYGLLIRDRSSIALASIFVTGGVVDAGYTGEIIVIMNTVNSRDLYIKAGEKIAQMIPLQVLTDTVVEVKELGEASRGAKGFGSTGA